MKLTWVEWRFEEIDWQRMAADCPRPRDSWRSLGLTFVQQWTAIDWYIILTQGFFSYAIKGHYDLKAILITHVNLKNFAVERFSMSQLGTSERCMWALRCKRSNCAENYIKTCLLWYHEGFIDVGLPFTSIKSANRLYIGKCHS